MTPDLNPDAATWLSASRCPGNHWFAILDISMDALVWDNLFHAVQPTACRLSCTIPKAREEYNRLLTQFLQSH
jgi:hypothetical protein